MIIINLKLDLCHEQIVVVSHMMSSTYRPHLQSPACQPCLIHLIVCSPRPTQGGQICPKWNKSGTF